MLSSVVLRAWDEKTEILDFTCIHWAHCFVYCMHVSSRDTFHSFRTTTSQAYHWEAHVWLKDMIVQNPLYSLYAHCSHVSYEFWGLWMVWRHTTPQEHHFSVAKMSQDWNVATLCLLCSFHSTVLQYWWHQIWDNLVYLLLCSRWIIFKFSMENEFLKHIQMS